MAAKMRGPHDDVVTLRRCRIAGRCHWRAVIRLHAAAASAQPAEVAPGCLAVYRSSSASAGGQWQSTSTAWPQEQDGLPERIMRSPQL